MDIFYYIPGIIIFWLIFARKVGPSGNSDWREEIDAYATPDPREMEYDDLVDSRYDDFFDEHNR